jgi:hypothetical protein
MKNKILIAILIFFVVNSVFSQDQKNSKTVSNDTTLEISINELKLFDYFPESALKLAGTGYTVAEYKMALVPSRGNTLYFISKSVAFTPAIKSAITKAQKGDLFIFSDIIYSAPGGEKIKHPRIIKVKVL